ncbi:MAG TPA: type II toxin-antitoxin system VapC family toxin [Solirubrobacteraceae bacterium]|nr:type II toxin-antitoxin system VapC family toxin [Solirubrobacteraceae bacterium]
MIVLDASVAVEILLGSDTGRIALQHVQQQPEVHVPEHFHIEVLSVLRRYSLTGELQEPRTSHALTLLSDLRAIRYSNLLFARAIWELRTQLTAYDAAYLALARHLGGSILTLDRGLANLARVEGRLIDLRST